MVAQEQQKPFVIGLDLGGTNSVFGIVDQRGNILTTNSIKTQAYKTAEDFVSAGVEALKPIIAKVGGIEQIKAMGIGAPNGNYYRGTIEFAPNVPWGHDGVIPLADMFSEKLGIPVGLTNDANAAAIGEMQYGVARGMKNFIMITLGTGVGGAVISDGRMVAGANGAAGEFGHMTINPAETETCACGRRGCVQQYVSASGIARLARKYLAEHEGESALRSVEKLTTKDVFDAAKNGDSAANAILENVYDAFGYAISAVCTVVDPEVVVIGGGVSKAGEMLVEGAKKGFLKYVFYPSTDVRFNLAVLGNDAGIYGCCKLLLDSLA